MNWHPEGELFASCDSREENVNVTLWAVIIVNLGVVQGDLSLMLDTLVFKDHGVTVIEEVDGGSVGGLDLSHASIIQYVRDIASANRTKSDFFLVTDPTPLLKNANYTTSCSCGGESFFNLS